MSETCENCGNSAMPPRGWENDWTCAECGHTQGEDVEPVLEEGPTIDSLIGDR